MRVGGDAKKKDGSGSRGPGTARGAEDAAGGDDGAEQFRFKKFGDEICDGHGAPAEEIEDATLAEATDAAASLEEIPEIFRGRRVDAGRSDGNELAKNGEEMIEGFREERVLGGVFRGEASDAGGGFGVAVVEEKRVAVGSGGEDTRIGAQDLAIEFLELEVAGDVSAKRAEGVREIGRAEARMKFLSDGAAADYFAALEKERLEPALREIERGD